MNNWTIQSNPVKQAVLTIIIIILGLLLMYGFRNFDSSSFSNSLAGFLLGVLLLVIGIPGLVTIGKETITVLPKERKILIVNKNLFRKKNHVLSFNEITTVQIGSLGTRSNGSKNYYLTLQLKSGKSFPLFFPAYYSGRFDRAIAEERRWKLESYLKQ
ncbi:MAG: hypothetical protein Q8N03_00005 [Ignavibacteria bacterium]|nr:hypothetical protein [Ignavibacteria bacterium]